MMKNINSVVLLTCSFVFIGIGASVAQKSEREALREAEYQDAKALVSTKKFEFKAIRAITSKGLQVDLTTNPNFLIITEDNAKAKMPYFGEVTNAGYSDTDGGINFEGKYTDYTVKENDKKRRISIEFKVISGRENYRCSITINALSSSTLVVSSINRSTIRYNGSINQLE